MKPDRFLISTQNRKEEMPLVTGFNLKYGDGYKYLPGWDQFVSILNSARGRKNMFIFRVITALINELDLCGADGFQALNAIEYWASDRLSSHPRSHYKGTIIGKSPPGAIDTEHETFSDLPGSSGDVPDVPAPTESTHTETAPTTPDDPISMYDMSMFQASL